MPGIPKKYAFLNTVGVLPRTISNALSLLGTNEVPGAGSSAVIMAWKAEVVKAGINLDGYVNDGVPWCGLFAAVVAIRAGKTPPSAPLWAQNWAKFGVPIAVNRGTLAKPLLDFEPGKVASLGDVLVYSRSIGGGKYAGHVNFYIGESETNYFGVGGNQSDSVTITAIAKSRCIAVRRPVMNLPPPACRPFYLSPEDGELGGSEA